MTKQELNRDIKRLKTKLRNAKDMELGDYYKFLEAEIAPEFKRLYNADNNFSTVSRENILFMFRANQRHKFIAFHNFGINIEL